ncbi:MAG: hypothetical protein ACI9OJ_003241 [Myxococcota bacterium]|jgi:hypothetical protein
MQRFLVMLAISAIWVGCPSDTGDGDGTTTSADATDGTDAADATDGTETTDGTEATDGTEGTDGTEATDGTDGTEATDGTEGTDGTDGPSDPSCATYCDVVTDTCTGDNAQYTDKDACLAYCDTAGQIPAGDAADTAGNTLGCRIYHAGVAGGGDAALAAEHCPHAGPSGANICGNWCENYCHLMDTNCGDVGTFADTAACTAACGDYLEDGEPGNVDGGTVQCRIYHAGVAGSDKANDSDVTHCPHAAPDGGGVCVDDEDGPTCESYCASVQTACGDAGSDTSQYADNAACMAYCQTAAKLDNGTGGETPGNTIACRSYHAGVASGSADDAVIHCPHAGASGGGVCGTWCENYCDLSSKNCGDTIDFGTGDCATACEGYEEDGAPGDTSGDSVQCRIYHLGVAGTDGQTSAAVHCPHGAPDGGGVCADTAVDPSCSEYCTAVMGSCSGDNAQYADQQACMDYCSTWGALPLGTAADTAGNTVGCRTYHAGVAAGSDADAIAHCPHAGPSGGNVCGTWCANYCHLGLGNCTGGNEIFANDDDCQAACLNYDNDGDAGATDGDDVQCRIYHLGVAGSDGATSAATHCPHGDEDGGGVCIDITPAPSCEDYCTSVMAACTGANVQYSSQNACVAYCETSAAIPAGTGDDTAGNTVGCRAYHAGVAAMSAANGDLHCSHAGPSGGGVCGSYCDTYCQLSETNCAGDLDQYESTEQCQSVCAGFIVGDDPLATAGDSVQCRIYHLGVAGSGSPDTNPTHCPHGGVFGGGGVCEDAAPSCDVYCAAMDASCPDAYADEAACMAYCDTWAQIPLGDTEDTAGNTVGCRTYHARVASTTSPALHCDHASQTGGNVCGTWCDNLCQLEAANCSANPNYADSDECVTTCNVDYSTAGVTGDTDGNTVQCRIYHLGVAGSDAGNSEAVHCPHAGTDGGGVCVGEVTVAGDSCDDAISIDVVPYTSAGNTDSANNLLACDQVFGDSDGNDIVYSFDPPQAAVYTATLNATFDSLFYTQTTCGTSCIEVDDLIGENLTETVEFTGTPGTPVYLVVDGYDPTEQGSFGIAVELSCVPSCVDLACGGDGCGGSCGTCDGGTVCTAGTCSDPATLPGNTCGGAIEITGLVTSGSTTGFTDDFNAGGCPSPPIEADNGAASPDAFYSYTPTKTGAHIFTLDQADGEGPTRISVLSSCGAGTPVCDVAGPDLFVDGTPFSTDLTAGTTYILALDGIFPGDVGDFTLTIEEPEVVVATPTYDGQIQAMLQNNCAGCHTGGNSGGHNIANSYAEASKNNSGGGACSGTTTVAECAVKRIMNGSMPLGGSVSAADKLIYQAWADGGFLEN